MVFFVFANFRSYFGLVQYYPIAVESRFSCAPPYARLSALLEGRFWKENFCPTHPRTLDATWTNDSASRAERIARRSPGANELLRFLALDVIRLVFSCT